MPTLTEISDRLSSLGLIDSGFTVTRDQLPDTPDKVVVLYGTSGFSPDIFMGDSPIVENPGLQVVVRGAPKEPAPARAQIDRIYQAMIGWSAFTQSGVRYLSFAAQGTPALFRRDANERPHFSVNFVVRKELSPTS